MVLKSYCSRRRVLRGGGLSSKIWVCASSYSSNGVASPRRLSETASLSDKPYYVTTPIFYVNASPHIGHMYSMVLADSLKRWQSLLGRRALLCTGTDEHGMKIQRAAALEEDPERRDPKKFADLHAATFQRLAGKLNLDHDHFIRTTDRDHIEAVQHFWRLLHQKGYIYESNHQGWYSVGDECFVPESALEKKLDPITGRVFPAFRETEREVEWTEERNYHFRMTALKDKLLEFYEQNPDWIIPATKMNEVVSWVKNSLEDLSISRPAQRLNWGITVPDDCSQTIYVWVDALVNYLTKAGFPTWKPHHEHKGGWPADVHVIGKDILRFHCVYWPALLLAVGLPLPKRVLSHAHWTLGHKKMSKSVGNVVNPFLALERFGLDAMRFYLLHDGGIANDVDYDNIYIVDRYKKLLQKGLGNLTGRITRPKLWSVADALGHAKKDCFTALPGLEQAFVEQETLLKEVADHAAEHMDRLNPSAALKEIMEAVVQTNKFMTDTEPWNLARQKGQESKVQLMSTVYLASESLRVFGILLQPFIPGKAGELLDILGVHGDKRTFAHARLGRDFEYGRPRRNPGSGPWQGLFPPLPVED